MVFKLKTLFSDRKPDGPAIGDGTPSSIPRAFASAPRPKAPTVPLLDPVAPADTRGAARFVPRRTTTVLVSESGKKIGARIINVSALGVAIEADFSQVSAETIVMIGERRVTPGRKIARGTVFLFEKPLAPSLCGPDFVM